MELTERKAEIIALDALGLNQYEIAERLGLSQASISLQLKDIRSIAPVKQQRNNLIELLPKTVKVLESTLDGHADNMAARKIAADVSLALNRGLGVLVDKQEVETTSRKESLEIKRIEMVNRLEIAGEFGAPDIPISADIGDIALNAQKQGTTEAPQSTNAKQPSQYHTQIKPTFREYIESRGKAWPLAPDDTDYQSLYDDYHKDDAKP
jgi:hypothetical protein